MKTYAVTTEGQIPGEAAVLRMLQTTDFRPFPRASDRKAWAAIAARPWIRPGLSKLLRSAARAADELSTRLRATDFAAFVRDGTRGP